MWSVVNSPHTKSMHGMHAYVPAQHVAPSPSEANEKHSENSDCLNKRCAAHAHAMVAHVDMRFQQAYL
jgi:hypothetical protein